MVAYANSSWNIWLKWSWNTYSSAHCGGNDRVGTHEVFHGFLPLCFEPSSCLRQHLCVVNNVRPTRVKVWLAIAAHSADCLDRSLPVSWRYTARNERCVWTYGLDSNPCTCPDEGSIARLLWDLDDHQDGPTPMTKWIGAANIKRLNDL